MGLSASQARLLTITSRKSDCEFQSMRLSHDKLSISRDLAQISNKYQNSLDQTKLMYDFYGNGEGREQLNYYTLMTPSALNDYTPITITNNEQRIVLSSKYASAAKAAGIPQEGLGCTPSAAVRNKFVNSLLDNNIIDEGRYNSIIKVPYNQQTGLGGGIQKTVLYDTITYDEFINKIRFEKVVPTNSSYSKDLVKELVVDRYDNVTGDTKQLNYDHQPCELTFGDLFDGSYDFILKAAGQDNHNNLTVAGGMADAICNSSIWKTMFDTVEKVLDNGTPKAQGALNFARSKIEELITNYGRDCTDSTVPAGDSNNDFNQDGKNIHTNFGAWRYAHDIYDSKVWKISRDNYRDMADIIANMSGRPARYPKVSDTIGMYGIYNRDDDGKRDNDSCMSMVTMNLSAMMKAYLTYFAHGFELTSSNPQYVVTNNEISSRFIDSDYEFTILSDVQLSNDDAKYANFYDTLLNQIAVNGWSENEGVTDNSYLQEMLQNGMMYISTVSDDYFYYQKNYATWSYVAEVSDDKAIAQAEAEYKTQKEKLNAKEQRLDLKMKNLDTEISTLTTEYDTVKNLISKNIEKGFKRYSA